MINNKAIGTLLITKDADLGDKIRQSLHHFHRAAFEISIAGSLENAVERLSAKGIDIALLDFNLKDAFDGFSRIHTQAPIPVVVLVNSIEDIVPAQLMKQPGVQDVLVKKEVDSGGSVLAHVIACAIDRYQMQEALKANTLRYLKKDDLLQKTQRKIIEQERLSAFGQMASGIAHDFNNALMPVLGYAELLLTHAGSRHNEEVLLEYLKMIDTSARDAVSIVARLREFYRHKEQGEVFLPVDFKELVEQAVLMTQPKWKDQALMKGVIIQMELRLEATPKIAGNESGLREVLTNLIFNAVDAMPQGGQIRMATRAGEGRLIFEVSDSGTGMSPETLTHCFEPFFTTKGKSGTGLGLAMVHGIVRRHEGTIEVQSEPGKGTMFTIELPYLKELPKASAPKTNGVPKKVRCLRVLVVDDEPMARQVMKDYLEMDGHAVKTAHDAPEALKVFTAGKFDIVITDRAMPGQSGDELAMKLKEISKETPVVMLTGFGDIMHAKNEAVSSVDRVISKPPTVALIREVLSQFCG
jgi:signal transduction histidine kinase